MIRHGAKPDRLKSRAVADIGARASSVLTPKAPDGAFAEANDAPSCTHLAGLRASPGSFSTAATPRIPAGCATAAPVPSSAGAAFSDAEGHLFDVPEGPRAPVNRFAAVAGGAMDLTVSDGTLMLVRLAAVHDGKRPGALISDLVARHCEAIGINTLAKPMSLEGGP